MKKYCLLFILTIIMIFSTGCTAKNDIEKLGVVVAMGIDITPDGKYMVVTQILKTQKQSSGGMSGSKNPTEVMGLISTGATIPEALDNLSTELGKKLELSHLKFIVVSDALAKSGVGELINFIARDHALRATIYLLVTKNDVAEVLKTPSPENTIPANAVSDILDLQEKYGYVPVVKSIDFSNLLASKTAAPFTGVINLHGDQKTGKVFKLMGTAIFKKDKLIGYLDAEETRGVQWIRSKVKTGSIVIPSPDKGNITIAIIHSKSTVQPTIIDNKLVIQLLIDVKGDIRDMSGNLDPMKNPEILNELAAIQNETIKNEIENALYATQKKYNADIFNFGEAIHRNYPVEWKALEEHWSEVFPTIDVEVIVNSSIQRVGVISKPLD